MSKDGKSLNEALKTKLGISGVRRSFHSYYAIFEIQDKGIIKMVYPKTENGDERTFKTRDEAIIPNAEGWRSLLLRNYYLIWNKLSNLRRVARGLR